MSTQRRLFLTAVMLCGLTAMIPLGAVQGQWNSKPFQQWTTQEAEAMLIDSPWAQTVYSIAGSTGGASSAMDTSTGGRLGTGTDSDIRLTIRLRSALPLRQALARLRQIKAKYEKMNDKDRSGIDAQNKPLLDCAPCDDYYIIALSPGPSSSKGIPIKFQTMSLDQAKLSVTLKDEKGESRELVNFVPPKKVGQEALFFFSRFDSKGAPLITPASHKVVVWFDPTVFGATANGTTRFEFDVAKMVANGQVVF